MPDIEWSPAAIEAADIAVSEGMAVGDVNLGRDAIYAAVKAQPVVALPPCPTCDGAGVVSALDGQTVENPCSVCNGSGVERMVPVSEIVAWLRNRCDRQREPWQWGQCINVAALIEREFGSGR